MRIPRPAATFLLGLLTAATLPAQTWTATSLHPAGTTSSQLNATTGSQQAGFATIGGKSHAAVWSGTAASFVDLHLILPADYRNSSATKITRR